MLDTFKRQKLIQFAVYLFVGFSVWWVILQSTVSQNDIQNQIFAATYGFMALLGAIGGVYVARKWNYSRSLMGRAILMFSLGLFAQEFGQLVYSFYIYFLKIEVPYPSIGDIGFFGSIPLYIYGVYLLSKAAGVKVTLKSAKNQIQAIVIPVLILAFSYTIFLQGYELEATPLLVILLDFGYPLGQAIYVSLALLTFLLSRRILGGVMKDKVLLVLIALFIQYLADYMFLLQAANGTWYAGGINDYTYLLSYFVMTLALFNLRVSEVRKRLVAK